MKTKKLHPSVSLSSAEESIVVGNTVTLTATTVPEDAVVSWVSEDEEVATISDGVVEAIAEGTTTITATITINGTTYQDACSITVTEE